MLDLFWLLNADTDKGTYPMLVYWNMTLRDKGHKTKTKKGQGKQKFTELKWPRDTNPTQSLIDHCTSSERRTNCTKKNRMVVPK